MTSGGRVRYVIDDVDRTVWLIYASPRHPKDTERSELANQQDSSAGTSKATYGGAMFAVTAVSQHGRWQIESIDTFTSSP